MIAWLRDLLNLKSEEEYIQCEQKVHDIYIENVLISISISISRNMIRRWERFALNCMTNQMRGNATKMLSTLLVLRLILDFLLAVSLQGQLPDPCIILHSSTVPKDESAKPLTFA